MAFCSEEHQWSGATDNRELMTSEALPGTPGPFEVRHESSAPSFLNSDHSNSATGNVGVVDAPRPTDEVPRRRYECEHYELCLGLAASLNWESFTCRGCSGETNQNLLWRARLTARKDSVAAKLLRAQPVTALTSTTASGKTSSTTAQGEQASAS